MKYFLMLLFAVSFSGVYAQNPFYLGGIQINEPDHKKWTSKLKRVGMNTVSITVYARNGIWDSTELWWTNKEHFVVKEIETAKQAGMKVVLIPRVLLDHYYDKNKFLWHGMIMPKSDKELAEWFQYYEEYILYWAKIAEKYKVDVFAIGSEMRVLSATKPVEELPELERFHLDSAEQVTYIQDCMSFSSQIPKQELWVKGKDVNYETLKNYLESEVAVKQAWAEQVAYSKQANYIQSINHRRELILAHWHQLIAKTRKLYSGKLTYAANFDNYQNIAFWDKLDFIGINAYFKLREYEAQQTNRGKYRDLLAGWRRVYFNINSFQKEMGLAKKVLFTELGYIYRENSTIIPWKGFGFSVSKHWQNGSKKLFIWSEQEINPKERALAMKALYHVNKGPDLLQGILYWKLTTKRYHLPYEPFGLLIRKHFKDPLLKALVRFREKRF
ncbi:MAG: hypothetical protein ACJAWV_002927 [Flammeovirgaceae bacterium]|jgi:hypothetical protein